MAGDHGITIPKELDDAKIERAIKNTLRARQVDATPQEILQGVQNYKQLLARAQAEAAHHTPTLLKDPAVERWAYMRDHIHEGFRFTRYNIGTVLWYSIALPVGVYMIASATTNRWDWAGKGRGESLLRNPPKPKEPASEQ